MGRTFKRQGDRIRAELEPFEVELLRQLRDGLRHNLEHAGGDDPVIARLFPPTVTGDDDADDELRRLIRDDLLQSKLDGLDALMEVLERGTEHRGRIRVQLEPDEAMLMLGVLNDLRLAIGARVGIEDIDRDTLTEDDPRTRSVAIMDHLGWLQEQLLALVDPASVRHYEETGPDQTGD
ncbi:MAG: DUF2017 family protein [Nitriliruptorales bacterium]|nr:DUF2017 family protein [Nitriliruptorales bacterium]